jgi:molybdopterin molybdotransferase
MITVSQAEQIILSEVRDFGTEFLPLMQSVGRVLAQNIYADRDLPPYNRVAMDGIAIDYQSITKGIVKFRKIGTQPAGVAPLAIQHIEECIEIMTGAVLPTTCDTVVRYEDLEGDGAYFVLKTNNIKQGQNIHQKGKDKRQQDLLVAENQIITSKVIQVAASVGCVNIAVKKLPKIVVISSGDELVDLEIIPNDYQIRRSNSYTLIAALQQYGVRADMLHLADNEAIIKEKIKYCIEVYDVIILSGGVSMGKFDYIPISLAALDVEQLFHKVAQRPGKPLWFGKAQNNTLVFALPGNPASTFMCYYRYVAYWLEKNLGITRPNRYALLSQDISFSASLQYFVPVQLTQNEDCQWIATPLFNNGSGDFVNLLEADAFMELPMDKGVFLKGEQYRVWLI